MANLLRGMHRTCARWARTEHVEFVATISRIADQKLGVDLRHAGDHLTIASIHPGLAADVYNNTMLAAWRRQTAENVQR
eukprot:3203557-Amphidinium_carterae.2